MHIFCIFQTVPGRDVGHPLGLVERRLRVRGGQAVGPGRGVAPPDGLVQLLLHLPLDI